MGRIEVTSWEPVDLGPILDGERVTPAPTAFRRRDGVALLYPGRLNLLMGETESCKTWALNVAIAQELEAENHVVLVDYEDTPEAQIERIRALGVKAASIAEKITYLQPTSVLDDLAREVLKEVFEARGWPTVVAIDGVTAAMSQVGLDPNKGPDVAAFYAGFPRRFARTGAAVVLTDHVTKDREGRGRWAIGSERKLSGLDGAAYGFEVLAGFGRERTGKVKITVAKDRCGHVRQHEGTGRMIAMLELQSWPDGGVSATVDLPDEPAGDGSFRPTYVMAQLAKVLLGNPGLTNRALRAAVKGRNDVKDLALELLVNDGFVEVRPGAKGARHHHLLRPYPPVSGGVGDAVDDGEF